eukprot:768681-Hanusia_phi.AAC.17
MASVECSEWRLPAWSAQNGERGVLRMASPSVECSEWRLLPALSSASPAAAMPPPPWPHAVLPPPCIPLYQ